MASAIVSGHSILRDNRDPEKFKTPQFAKIPEWHKQEAFTKDSPQL